LAVQARITEIVEKMPGGLSEAEQLLWLAEWMIENVYVYNSLSPTEQHANRNNPDFIRETHRFPDYSNALGALMDGRADDQGIAVTFAALAYEAGIRIISINGIDSDGERMWNMVNLDNNWYHIDMTRIIRDGWGETFFLASDEMIEGYNTPVSFGEADFAPVPNADRGLR